MTLQRKPIDLIGWHLISQADMLDALSHLSGDGWRGAVYPAEGTWRLELHADSPTRNIIASIGAWLIDDMGLRLITDAECAANYDQIED